MYLMLEGSVDLFQVVWTVLEQCPDTIKRWMALCLLENLAGLGLLSAFAARDEVNYFLSLMNQDTSAMQLLPLTSFDKQIIHLGRSKTDEDVDQGVRTDIDSVATIPLGMND